METRELRYFVAVAEELHFGRAAERLSMAQPPLSRAIQQLERRLGVTLFDRGSRAIRLTDAGTVLLAEARVALDAVEAAGRLTRRTAVGRPTVVLAAKAGASRELLARLLDRYGADPGAAPVEVILCGPGEPEALLRLGTADVALLQRPYDSTAGWESVELLVEQQVLILPAGHPLSVDQPVTAADVAAAVDLPTPRWPRADGTYPEGAGPAVRDHTQLFQLIALGRAYAWVPESAVPPARDDLAVVRVADASAVTTVLAWRHHHPSSCVAGFVGHARAMAPTLAL